MDYKKLINSILDYCSSKNYSDIHLNTGTSVRIRDKSGDINTLDTILLGEKEIILPELGKDNLEGIIKVLIGEQGFRKFRETFEVDSSYSVGTNDRYRVNCYMDTGGYSIALRRIPNEVPTLDELGLGDNIKDMCRRGKGLILVTGPTGSGKSTNLASMIDFINKNYKKHIITIEDPVEFSFVEKKSLINQREVGSSTKGFTQAIRSALREDPDVIMVGEMRDPETIKAAITLAETGHLVLSTLHTNDSVQTIDRIVDIFPGSQQKQIRMQLSMSLVGVVSQRLLPKLNQDGRIASREVLVSNDAIRNLIIQGKSHQIYSVLEVGQKQGMVLMDKYLMVLYQKKLISKETLLSYARDKSNIEMMID